MTRLLLAFALVVGITGSATAQTVEGTFDLSVLGWAGDTEAKAITVPWGVGKKVWALRLVDIDLIAASWRIRWRAAVLQPDGSLCLGTWFTVPDAPYQWEVEAGESKLRIELGRQRFTLIRFDRPACAS